MRGYITIISLNYLQMLHVVMSANVYAEKKPFDNIWLTDLQTDDNFPASRYELNDQSAEIADDVMSKDASLFPRIPRKGHAGEEFFLKASKSVPRIGRRNNDYIIEMPKRSLDQDQVNVEEYWPNFQWDDVTDFTRKYDFDLSYGCRQQDAKTILSADMYNFVCNDQYYCSCASPKRYSSLNANY